MNHSNRAKQNMTNQLKSQLEFYQKDLVHERASLKKVKSYLKYNLPGVKSMISQHERGVTMTLANIKVLKRRIKKLQRNNAINKIIMNNNEVFCAIHNTVKENSKGYDANRAYLQLVLVEILHLQEKLYNIQDNLQQFQSKQMQ